MGWLNGPKRKRKNSQCSLKSMTARCLSDSSKSLELKEASKEDVGSPEFLSLSNRLPAGPGSIPDRPDPVPLPPHPPSHKSPDNIERPRVFI
ncbi:hypothetical protein EYF80_004782 [Liparis tanakae]|uniref:Uncharacterized protein n=1 Tax=Liparis tanakae TaxID=230148 RepID=A0A4Z2J3Y7_9TELE|nr:hypothetical protein EYF80_004782 [Liparis tanakae]